MRRMSQLQPRMKEIQDRHSGDRTRVSQETMRLYRESGVSPVGCLGPLIIQMPILIGLFRVLIQTPLHQAGRPGRAFPETIFLDYLRPDPLGSAAQRRFSLVEPGRAGPLADNFSLAGGCFYLGAAEDDDDPIARPAAAVQPKHDALDDSHISGVLFLAMA